MPNETDKEKNTLNLDRSDSTICQQRAVEEANDTGDSWGVEESVSHTGIWLKCTNMILL